MTPTSRNLTRSAGLLLAAFLCASLVCADNKPWKTKPYQQWNDKDIQAIMTDSPWVKLTTIRRTWLPVPMKEIPPQQQINGGIRDVPSVAGAPASNTGAVSGQSEQPAQELNVSVYWDSSRVIRAASARQRSLHGEMTDSQVEQYATAPQEEYQIAVSMADMTPFIKNDENFFQANSSLEIRRTKLKLPPSHVVYLKDSGGNLKQAVFFFPKKTSSDPTIPSDETDVEFRCKIADSNLHVGFKPQEMTDQAGPDL
jgi:hypothetical protein